MSCVHGLEHVECLTTTNLTNDDTVGAHTQSVTHQIAYRHLSLAFDVRRATLEREHVHLVEAELSSILHCDDALGVRDEARQHIQAESFYRSRYHRRR